MPDFDLFSRLAVALAIGLMVGIERGWTSRNAEDNGRAAGVRTFGLAGLTGGIAGILHADLGPILVATAFAGFAAAFGAFSWLEARARRSASVTTLVAGLLTFLLGVMATLGEMRVAIAAAVAMTVLLAVRAQLHGWLLRLTPDEIRAGLILLVMTFLMLPLLPDRPLDPWGAVNLHEVWLLAILVALISFVGYVAVRVLGGRWGIVVTAAAGGLASSTAATLAFARLARAQPSAANLLAGGILVSGAVMALRVAAMALVLNPALAALLAPVLGAAVAGLALAAGLFLTGPRGVSAQHAPPDLVIDNPLDVGTSLKIALFLVGVMLAVALLQDVWGQAGVLAVAAVSGIMDVDAITLSMARRQGDGAEGAGSVDLAVQAILVAVAVNTASKALMAGWVGGRAIGLRVALASLPAALAATASYLWLL